MKTNLLSVLEHGAEAVESRRNALAFAGRIGAGALFSMLPFGLANEARAQSAGDDLAILNYALTLEYLESRFYNQSVFIATTPPTAPPATAVTIPTEVRPLFEMIRADENKHVAFLTAAITDADGTPVAFAATDFDFTAGGMFMPTDYATFLILSQGFEDTGVRAYKGQAPNFSNTPAGKTYLTAALNIHSVEARHAAAVRRVRGLAGWIPGDGTDAPAPIRAVYQGGQTRVNGAAGSETTTVDTSPSDDNVTQGGVTLAATEKYTLVQIQESFDEPLGTATVKNIADPFVIPSLGA